MISHFSAARVGARVRLIADGDPRRSPTPMRHVEAEDAVGFNNLLQVERAATRRISRSGPPPDFGHKDNDGSANEQAIEAPIALDQLIRFNVGGRSFRLRESAASAREPNSFLAVFAELNHDERMESSHGFLDGGEYYFERSARLFEPIYRFYTSGTMHRPLDSCIHEFVAELAFWRIPQSNLADCCSMTIVEDTDPVDEDSDAFAHIRYGETRRRLWLLCEGSGSLSSTILSFVSILFVLLSISALVVSSIPDFQVPVLVDSRDANGSDVVTTIFEPHPRFEQLETVCIAWFTGEYLARLVIAPLKCKFVKGTLNVVDLMAIVPFYIELLLQLLGIDSTRLRHLKGMLLVVRIMRVLRVVRVLKLGRYSSGMRSFALTMKNSAKQLAMMGMVMTTGIVFFSTLVYFIEKDHPDTPFDSIPAAFWWCIVTMTTVGYGDVVPVTIAGKVIASGAIVSGVLVLALPITIIVDNFMRVAQK